MRLKLICAVFVGVLLVVAPGCGSKKKSASTTTASTTTAMTTNSSTTSASGGTNLTSSDCANLVAAEQTVAKVTGGTVPSDINTQIARLNTLAKTAPAAVRPDFAALATAAGQLAKLHLKAGQTKLTAAQVQQLMATLDANSLLTASEHIATWAATNCTKP